MQLFPAMLMNVYACLTFFSSSFDEYEIRVRPKNKKINKKEDEYWLHFVYNLKPYSCAWRYSWSGACALR